MDAETKRMPTPRELFQAMRRIMLKITVASNERETRSDARRLVATLARSARKGRLAEKIDGMQAVSDARDAILATWVDPSEIEAGRGGAFDACDLRCHLALARRAGVAHIPAVQILALTEDEMAVASGTVEMPQGPARALLAAEAGRLLAEVPAGAADGDGAARPDPEDVRERLMAAMDDLPEGWMVRHARCGHSTLKSLAGTGLAAPDELSVPFGKDFEMGPGWVRLGNRRMVDARDRRVVESLVHGRDQDAGVFLARPWVRASRWQIGPDPHRHGSPFAGKGAWPAEWRAFVDASGTVTGVANYYGWCGEATPTAARMALEVRRLAQRVADEAKRQGAHPQQLDVEMHRAMNMGREARLDEVLGEWPARSYGMTLDFIETTDGLLLLEGGPPHTPLGGGHCTAFAGAAGQPIMGRPVFVEGVAFRIMDHVSMADMTTWRDGDRTGRILPWADAEALATNTMEPHR